MVSVRVAKSERLDCGYSLFVSFPYSDKILGVIRSFPLKNWDKNRKEWELPILDLGKLVDSLPYDRFNITGLYQKLQAKSAELPADFTFKTTPFQHQIEGVQYGLSHDRWLLGDEQGLGKTKQVIDIAVAKKKSEGYKHCLIICGVNGLKWNWLNEISTHSNETGHILGSYYKSGRRGQKLLVGSNADKLSDLRNLPDDYFIVTNVESLRSAEITDQLVKLIKADEINMVAIDEVHKCKNPSSQQGKAILKLKPQCRIAMTGTPLMNTPFDIYIILRWLGYENHSFYSFQHHYATFGGFGGYQVMNYNNLDELENRLDSIMLRRKKEEVLDLPDKMYIDEYVEMTPKQSQIYKEVEANIISNIDQIALSPNPLAALIRLRQATGFTGILSSTIQESAKLDRLEELVDEVTSNGKKTVIFSNWTQMTDPICERLQKYAPLVITGKTNDGDRMRNVNTFQNDDNHKVIVGTIGAMGTGLTLTAGTVVIFTDLPWTRAAYDQAVDRCHRIGAKNNVTIYNLTCKGTIDERIQEIVRTKGELSDAIVDGVKKPEDKKALLQFLLS